MSESEQSTRSATGANAEALEAARREFESALQWLEYAQTFAAKTVLQGEVTDAAQHLLTSTAGIDVLFQYAPRFDSAGLFAGSDWDSPATLVPSLVSNTFEQGQKALVTLECLSQLRLLALATGDAQHPGIASEQAQHFLTQVLALNLNRLFVSSDEALRVRLGNLAVSPSLVLQYLVEHIGYEDIIVHLIDEIWRLLAQRPVQPGRIKAMVTQIALVMAEGQFTGGDVRLGADRLVSALFGPTQHCQDDPGIGEYCRRLGQLDSNALAQEASGFARSMHDVGLVSDYHAAFVRWLNDNDQTSHLVNALGLSATGADVLRTYPALVQFLITEAIHPATADAVYGLSQMLERGILYSPPIAPALWRQAALPLSNYCSGVLQSIFGAEIDAQKRLLAGVIALLGQPLGIGQGNNPTCQSARAISLWASTAPDYLLELLRQAACLDSIDMHFEGRALHSAQLPLGLAKTLPLDTDPVSVVLVPHLDRIYQEMGRLCGERSGDPHRWINPEFHGWWVGREFFIAVDVATGQLQDYETFVERFFVAYHPYYNGNQAVIHPQPVGIAMTDSRAQFVGWHAVSLLRVALDQHNQMRVYFYNPNNDSGQNWGNGVEVATQGCGERFGEASLPFAQFASRLYIFHDDRGGGVPGQAPPAEAVQEVIELARNSWAQTR